MSAPVPPVVPPVRPAPGRIRLAPDPVTFMESIFMAAPMLWFLALIPIIILLYLLKLRRTPIVISSTLLWMKSLQDLTANAPFQRLRKNLLMFLQILILILIVIALARPYINAEGRAGATICILLDRSASMQAIEGEATRMDLAKQAALEVVEEMQRGDRVMLVTFAENSNVLVELTSDRARLRDAIQGSRTIGHAHQTQLTPSSSRTPSNRRNRISMSS